MNNVYARNKKKRTRSSSSDGKNSFVQNVTARMTGLLPATITKWFSSPTTSNANGSTAAGDTTDSSTDEETDRTAGTRPPVKRMRFSTNISPVPVPAYTYSEGMSKWSNKPVNSTKMVHSTPDAYALKRGSIFSSTSINPTPVIKMDANPSSGDNEFNTTVPSSHSLSSSGPSLQRKRKSLFDNVSFENNSEARQAKSVIETSKHTRDEPTYRASLLGSPFYKGRTMYGGAGASNYLNEPNIKQRSLVIVNESRSNEDTISGAARRVMDILESYSSPLTEARRIPSYTRPHTHQSSDLMSPRTTISQLQSIQVPSVGTFLNIKQRSRLMDSTSVARQIMASQTSTSDFMPYSQSHKRNKVDNSSSTTSSMSSIKPRMKTTSKKADRWQEELPPLDDHSSVALNMDQAQLPKFSFGIAPAQSKSVQAAFVDNAPKPLAGTLNLNAVNMETNTQDDLVINSTFKFSSPIRISKDLTSTIITPPSVTPSFDKVTQLSPLETAKLSVIEASPKDDSKEWRCTDCWVNNKASIDKCVCCGSAKPSSGLKHKINRCTKCKTLECEAHSDICVACKKVDDSLRDSITANKNTTSTWKCDSCWVSNNMSDEKCVCCAGKRVQDVQDTASHSVTTKSTASVRDDVKHKGSLLSTSSTPLTMTPSMSSNTLTKSELFKPIVVQSQTNQWECPSCLVRNDNSKLKCVCCETEKPGTVNTLTKSELFKPLVIQSQTNQWECPSCLVRNDNSKLKCVCCETEKPGTVKESDKKLFNFGIANTGFKFGIQSPAKEDNPSATNSTVKFQINSKETETNNNSLKTAPTFSFGMPSGGSSDTVTQKNKENKNSPATKVDTLSNKDFALGNSTGFFKMPSASDTLTQNAVQNRKEESKQLETEKEQEVPKAFAPIKLGQQKLEPSTYFGSFANNQDSNKIVPISPEPSVLKVATSKTTAAESTSETNKPLFTNSQIVPVTTSSNTPNPLLSVPATTSLGQLSAEATTTPSQMFQKVEPTVTTVKSTSSLVFSFGSNKPALPINDNTAKFNFSFGAPTFNANNDTTNSNALVPQQSAPVKTLSSGTSLVLNSAPNTAPKTTNIFGSAVPPATESIWATPAPTTAQPLGNNVNIFSTSSSSNKSTFNFGSTPFKVGNVAPNTMFNNSSPNTPAFGGITNNAAPTFGNTVKPTNNLSAATFAAPQLSVNSSLFGNAQSKSDMFGIQTQQVTNQSSLFMTKEAANSPFGGGPSPKAIMGPGLFGAPVSMASAAAAGPASMLPTAATASAPAHDVAPTPNFNFAAPGLFSFNQQQQQPPQHGVYSFGATTNVAPQVQFNMGSPGNIAPSPNTIVRKVRKAVRRPR